ncbi:MULTISPECIES: D-lactate dehydrogenase [unclassified Vibrio]|uniref:Quinone-dependent D-lactate dehydrogenase n=1 Tax=Vibrio sp. HB236076 TaxID=3232307 RepID=A0AB39HKN3_9VIBR|nr:D-lactate dehydrogenase [Vibrio sp. HB161653]MDP5253128.1 D-lactate dehydrogenase [Vibrio sp. HB161653]
MDIQQLINQFEAIVGSNNVLNGEQPTQYYRRGFRSGQGAALAVVFPTTIWQQWQVIQACVNANCIIIMQAAKTGLTEGSAPSGNDYDREVVIINVMKMPQIHLIDGGKQAICLPGATLHNLEKTLKAIGRAPHSVIGSSTLGATVVGGIANNSGGALVKRGPAYTELALFAQVDEHGQLHLVNHLGIEGLGDSPETILTKVQEGDLPSQGILHDQGMASDREYQQRVRDVSSDVPSRFNADERRLFEASGCAGKLGVFAVRVDTYPIAQKEQVFYLGCQDPKALTQLRKEVLTTFKHLPEMGEYLHRDIFNLAEKYGKDTFLSIDKLGTERLPTLFALKAKLESALDRLSWLPKQIPDKCLYYLSQCFPQHLPARMLDFRDRYEHHLILKMSDEGIEEARTYLQQHWQQNPGCDYFECDKEESKKAYLHRFAAAGAAIRYETIHHNEVEDIVALDIALRRNDDDWVETLPQEVKENLVASLYYGHFFCYVFHQDYIFKKGTDTKAMKKKMLAHLNDRGAKYPAEHNVGHLYEAENSLQTFYHQLDPTNTFNPGIGKMDKYQRNCQCC